MCLGPPSFVRPASFRRWYGGHGVRQHYRLIYCKHWIAVEAVALRPNGGSAAPLTTVFSLCPLMLQKWAVRYRRPEFDWPPISKY